MSFGFIQENSLPFQKSRFYLGSSPQKIGSGTYGNVYKANDFAIKEFKNKLDSSTLWEISILKMLNGSPYIVPLIDVSIDNSVWLVMSWALMDLGQYIKTTPQYNFLDLSQQLINGLSYLHSRDIIHRDIKPQNILVYSDRLVYSDFGLSRMTPCADDPEKMTNPVYSLWYRAPEVILGQPYDDRSDIWALGCVFWELMTRQVMFMGRDEQEQMTLIIQKLGQPLDIGLDQPKRLLWPSRRNSLKWKGYYDNIKPVDPFQPIDPYQNLIANMLAYNPKNRISSYEAIHLLSPGIILQPFVCCWDRNRDLAKPFNPVDNRQYFDEVNKMIEMGLERGISKSWIYNAVYYFSIVANTVRPEAYDLYAVACLSIAAKMDRHRPNDDDPQLFNFEKNVLETLNFNLLVVNPIDIIDKFKNQLEDALRQAAQGIAMAILPTSLPSQYNPYIIAQGCLQMEELTGTLVSESSQGEVQRFIFDCSKFLEEKNQKSQNAAPVVDYFQIEPISTRGFAGTPRPCRSRSCRRS